MVLIEKHAQEIFWLQRRIDFLKKLDDLLDDEYDDEDDIKLKAENISTQYKKVENPEDMIKRMKELYGREIL